MDTIRSPRKSFFALLLGAGYGLFCAGQAGALPGTPTIQNPGPPANNATFASTATTLTVTQLATNLAIVWTPSGAGSTPAKAFDILAGETVTFLQPSTTAVAYNSISCAACSATIIAGTLQSRLTSDPTQQGGRVWLFDPNGIAIGQGAIVNVGGFIASSLQGNISAWLANPNNPLQLTDGGGATPTNGAVTNDGNITASDTVNGYVALIGNSVAATHTGATGSIDVGFGSINLAAGRVATITALAGGGLNFALSSLPADGLNVNNGTATSAVANSGVLTGAAVTLSANVANALFASAVNTSGVIRAVNMDSSGGTIKLVGAGGPVVASGTLDASAITGTDGTVQITGDSVNLGPSTFHGTLEVASVVGDIGETGAVTSDAGASFTSAANINLGTQANDLKNPTFAFTGTTAANLGYRDVGSILQPATNLHGGNITLISDGGTVKQSGAINAAAGTFTASADNQDIVIDNTSNTFSGAVKLNTSLTGTGSATIYDAVALNLGASSVGGTLTATSLTGDITESGALIATAVTGSMFTSGGSINLATQANDLKNPTFVFTGTTAANLGYRDVGSILLPATNLHGGNITLISDGGTVKQSGAINAAAGTFTASADNQDIVIDNTSNTFSGAVKLNTSLTGTGSATIYDAVALNLGASSVGGTLTATSLTGDITESGVLIATAATGSMFTSGGSINLGTQANDLKNPTFVFTGTTASDLGYRDINSILLPATNLHGGNITLISDTGTVKQSGAINAAAGTFTASATNQDIVIDNTSNTFSGTVTLNTNLAGAGSATIYDAVALKLGTSSVGGTLTATSLTGDITESGVLTALATTGSMFTSGGNIDLSTSANNLHNPTFVFTGTTAANLGYQDVGSIALPATDLHGGNITLISDGGGITQTGAINAGAGSFTASALNQAIVLGNTDNTFSGTVTLNTNLTGTGAATIYDKLALNLGTSSVGGTLTATSLAGDITESGVLTALAATGSSFTSGGNIDLSTRANNLHNPAFVFTGTSAANLGYRDVGSIALPATDLRGGNITLISDGGSITQTGAIKAAAGSFTASAINQDIILDNTSNIFSGAVSLNTNLGGTGPASIFDTVALNLGVSSVGGTLSATSLTGGIIESGVLTDASSSQFISGSTIDLSTQVNNLTGIITLSSPGSAAVKSTSVKLGTSTVGALTAISTGGDITESGVLTTTNAGAVNSFTSTGNINLSTQTNSFTGSVSLNAPGNASISAVALNFGTSTVGALTATATAGSITETGGALTTTNAGGTSSFGSTGIINLSTQANNFAGSVSLNTPVSASISSTALKLGTSTVGTLTATSTVGDITESGVLTAGIGSSFSSAANIDLSTSANNLHNPAFIFTGTTAANLGYQDVGSIALPATDLHGGNITLISDTGGITQSGAIKAGAGSFTASALNQAIVLGNTGNTFSGTVTLNTNLTGTGSATIYDAVALKFGASSVGGSLTATSLTGDITETGVLTALALTGSSFTSGGNIDLSTSANNLHNPAFIFTGTTAANLGYRDVGSISLPATDLHGGNITLISDGGSITQSGAIKAGAGSFTASALNQAIILSNASNTFSGAVSLNTNLAGTGSATIVDEVALNLGTSSVGGSLMATSLAGGITESGVLTDANVSQFVSGSTIDLSTQVNNLTGVISLSSPGSAAVKSTSVKLGASTVGALTATSTSATADITESGVLTTTNAGAVNSFTSARNINLSTQANNFAGSVALNAPGTASVSAASLNLGTSAVGALTATSTAGDIIESGALATTNINGANTFIATTGNINLSTQANNFAGSVSLTAPGTASISSTALNLGASTVGTLTATSTAGDVTESGVLTTTNASAANAFTSTGNINLSTAANNFAGSVSLTAPGTASIDSTSLNLGTSTVGTLTASSTAGDIAESGVLTTTNASAANAFTSTGNINLSTAANNFAGSVSLTAPGAASIGSTSLNLGTSAVGALTASSTAGDITESGVLSASASSFTSTANIDLSTQANTLPGAAFTLTGATGNLAFHNTGAINLAATTVPGSITLLSDTGAITQTGAITATAATLTANQGLIDLSNSANNFTGAVSLNTAGAASIDSASLNLGASLVGGALTASSTAGDITQSGVLSAPSSSFTSVANIDLSTQANLLPGAAFVLNGASGNLAFRNTGDINLAATTVPGSITLVSDTGAITQTGAITATAATLTASQGLINLSNSANGFTGAVSLNTTGAASIDSASLNLGTSSVGGTLTATSATGAIVESGVLTATNGSTFTSAGKIDLSTQANLLDGTVALNSVGDAAIKSDTLNFGASNVQGKLTATATTGGIGENGVITASGDSSFSTLTANQNINLATQTNKFSGAVALNTAGSGNAAVTSESLNLGASSVGGTLSATSTIGDITESGVLDPTSSVFTSAGNINLGTQANVLSNVTFVFKGTTGALNFRDVGNISLAATNVPGTITLTSDTGSISETGVISATSGTFTTSAANQSINLGTQTNTFTGPVVLSTQGSGGNAAVKAATLNLGASTVGGTLAATATTGNITETGVLTATGGSTFTSTAGNIDLSSSTNVLGGTVTAAATNGFVNVKATQFAAVDAVAKNDITLNATAGAMDHLTALTFAGNVTADATGAMTLDGVDAGLTSTTGNVTLSAGTSISQTFAYNPTAAGTGLKSNDISIRGNTVTLNVPNLGSPGNFVGMIANNLTTSKSNPSNLYFAVLTPSGQKMAPANLKINGLSALPVTPGVFLAVGNSLPQTEFNIGSPAYLSFVKTYESAPTFDLSAGQVETSAESLASALNVAANSQQGTSSVNGILGSTPDANISLFNIVGVCLPADQRDDEEAAKHKDCVPAKTTDNRLPKPNPSADALSSILVASRARGGAAAQELR